MSTTITTALVGSSTMTVAAVETQCPTCGYDETHDSSEAQLRIQELEGLVQDLTKRAAMTANKLADYEDEIRRLRATESHTRTLSQSQPIYESPRSSVSLGPTSHTDKSTLSPTQPPSLPDTTSQTSPPTYQSRLSTLASLLPYRRSSSTTTSAPASVATSSTIPPPTPVSALPTTPTSVPPHTFETQTSPASSDNTSELQDALTREQGLRKAAESQLSQASTELEELTVQLFSQANEMVAQERKARAKLEERVAVLERRDIEKRSRLERLEKSMARVERLKALVG
ncbi:GDPGTP exchange factor Sec2p [Penicillium malachiteum]|uniref:GDPGTP exchange factor Sec2p n=1 Tax=Penicillium malachiteum TaxID=1324776 RepID=UPI002547DEDF|nr:GDPGTP exchange factor Sec2p [Penicillium malachiteum]KAJ5736973.1 GDPGTP exchange factor Sec2p [Penicillium malachiteum]